MSVIRAKKNKKSLMMLSLLLGIGSSSLTYSLVSANPSTTSTSWPSSLSFPSELYSHGNNSITATNTSCPGYYQGPDTTNSAVTLDEVTSQVNTIAKVSGDNFQTQVCNGRIVTGPDNTVYTIQVGNTPRQNTNRLVATRNNTILWTKNFAHLPTSCNYPPQIRTIALGYDGDLYATVDWPTASGCTARTAIIGINHLTAASKFDTQLPSNTLAQTTGLINEIMPYASGIVVANNGIRFYYFNYDGTLDNAKTFQPSMPTNTSDATTIKSSITKDGRIYSSIGYYQGGIYKSMLVYRDLSDYLQRDIIIPSGKIYNNVLEATPSKGLVVLLVQNSERYIAYYAESGLLVYEKNLASETTGRYMQNGPNGLAVDNMGNVIVTRTMYTTNVSPQEQYVFVDSFNPSGVKTNLFNSENLFATPNQDRFVSGTFGPRNLGSGKIFLQLCRYAGSSSPSSCSSTGNPTLVTIPMPGSFDYLRSGIYESITSSTIDSDTDGLTAMQEYAQGTSDFIADTDLDGLSDLIESTSFTNRNSLFCNSTAFYCEYPSPLQRDLYVEVDWMVKPGTSGYSMQPNSLQINSLKTAFQNKGILAHFDTGQLGGGSEVPYNQTISFSSEAGMLDFYDYKSGGDGISAQFNQDRYRTYHYLLLGYNYSNNPSSSGGSYAGDDDTFVSYGLIKDTFTYDSFDVAIAGTTIHEIGHTLCLTNFDSNTPAYPVQPAACRYSGVDTYAGNGYLSAMNYSKQLSLVDYSTGSNGSMADHNDWAAIRLQDFANQDIGDPSPGVNNFNAKKINKVRSKFIPGPTKEEIKAAKELNRN